MAVECAAVTEMVALQVARLEGSGDPESAYTLAMETFGEGLKGVSNEGKVVVSPREERLDEKGRVRAPKSGTWALNVADVLGSGALEVDLSQWSRWRVCSRSSGARRARFPRCRRPRGAAS